MAEWQDRPQGELLAEAIVVDLDACGGLTVHAALLDVISLHECQIQGDELRLICAACEPTDEAGDCWPCPTLRTIAGHLDVPLGPPSPPPDSPISRRRRRAAPQWVLPRRDCPACARNTALHPNGALYQHSCRPGDVLPLGQQRAGGRTGDCPDCGAAVRLTRGGNLAAHIRSQAPRGTLCHGSRLPAHVPTVGLVDVVLRRLDRPLRTVELPPLPDGAVMAG